MCVQRHLDSPPFTGLMSESSAADPRHQIYNFNETAVAVSLEEPHPEVDVPETLVHDLWHLQRFDGSDLTTTNDKGVRIRDPGQPNSDAGPDFLNAHVRIGDVDWKGHVEVHTSSRGWFDHNHNDDPRYDSVILHVTLHVDMWTGGLLRSDGSTIPEIVLYPRLDAPLRTLLHSFRTRDTEDDLPCATHWTDVPANTKNRWIDQLARERIIDKKRRLSDPADASLEQRLHERLFAGLGYSKNDEPMSTLAQRLPPSVVRPVESPRDREALHLGVAGLLPAPRDLLDVDRQTADYVMDRRDRFRRLQVDLEIPTMASTNWTFFRLRPHNFPPLRIAQAAAWYNEGGVFDEAPIKQLRSALDRSNPTATLRELLASEPSDFWRTHYHLTNTASEHEPSLGPSRRETLIVNAVIPALLLDAERRGAAAQGDAAIDVLRALSASSDQVTTRFEELGTEAVSAFQGQGLHQLYREYCSNARCLDCKIGQHILRS